MSRLAFKVDQNKLFFLGGQVRLTFSKSNLCCGFSSILSPSLTTNRTILSILRTIFESEMTENQTILFLMK